MQGPCPGIRRGVVKPGSRTAASLSLGLAGEKQAAICCLVMTGRCALAIGMAGALVVSAAEVPASYRGTAQRIINAAMEDATGYSQLSELCDQIGNRLSGSPSLERAVDWSVDVMKKDGLQNVRKIPAKVPHWVRGREHAEIVAPQRRPLTMLGLGGSVGTPAQGITAPVLVLRSFEDLERRGKAAVAGKIVLYNAPFENYFRTVQYRTSGASRAAKLGAVAALVRSVTPLSLQNPHTGAMDYEAGTPKIPTAAVTIEDAELIQRLTAGGLQVRVHLEMEAHTLADADSADVIGEIPGRENPEQVVVIGGHLDSWDVGQGAQDDGSGIMAALAAAHLIHKLGLQPRRTLRVVFWTNEENGGAGAKAYRDWVGDRIRDHVAAIEMDGGAEKPVGFSFGGSPAALERLTAIGGLLDPIGASTIQHGGGGADIGPLMQDGVPGLGLRTVGTHYFDWHHSPADTVDKVNPQEFRMNVATMAVMAYVLADMPERLP